MNKSINYPLLVLALIFFGVFRSQAQQFFFSTEKPNSCAATDGIATIVPMRGVPPFTYQWNTGSTELSIRNVPKGVYSATMTDASGATVSHTLYLNSDDLDVNLISSYPSGGCNPNSGGLVVLAQGGVAPYTYTWSDGQTGASTQSMSPGTYTVTVSDATGCTAESAFEVKQLPGNYFPWANTEIMEWPDCANPANGEIRAYLNFTSYPPFAYTWSNGATGETLTNATTGTYTVTATDALGCSSVATVEINNKLDITSNVICAGGNTGTLAALLVNATTPVNYQWSNGQSGANLSGLADGSYTVTATDANGCTSVKAGTVDAPGLFIYDSSPNCFSGNNGIGSVWVNSDSGVSYLWDNGDTDPVSYSLSPGPHNVTVTTAMGCVLVGTVSIRTPLAPPIVLTTSATAADCTTNQGGSITVSAQGGPGSLIFNVYGPNGFLSSDINNLQNIQGGEYTISAYSNSPVWCYANANVQVPDASGFEPSLFTNKIDCVTGFGDAAILGVTTPGAQYVWSNGSSAPAIFNLTDGCYSVTVSAGASCNRFFEFCLYSEQDSLNLFGCSAIATGKLINDLGVPGCNGTQGIPYQLIRTQPSGALNFTDYNGDFRVALPTGTYDLDAPGYDPADIVCPVNDKHTVNAVIGNTVSGLDFHFMNNNAIDHRLRQRALRTAQPGYPYSLRLEVCNDGAAGNPGTLDLEYGNFLGAVSGHHFSQHPGAFVLNNETLGIPNNDATFSFPAIAPGACELLQLDMLTPTTTSLNTAFVNAANVSPNSGDPTPANNISVLHNTVMGAFDPNSVLAYPARNGNPHDGGEIIRYEDNTIVYQIFFQNTGNAPADLVIVRDKMDENLDLATIRNISATHNMSMAVDEDNNMMVFKFANINLPDSTSDYAGSIGSIQYEIDLKPGVALGALVEKQALIYFDFNPAVITNQNVLELVNSSKVKQLVSDESIRVFPNPTDNYFGFYCVEPSTVKLYDALGKLVATEQFEGGLQQMNTAELASGVYLIQVDSKGKIRNGKVVVSHK